jgi:hypothetical protein
VEWDSSVAASYGSYWPRYLRVRVVVFEKLTYAGRFEHWELAGGPEWSRASFVVSLKHLPV